MSEPNDSVVAFVAEFTGVKPHRLTPDTTLFGDLGVDGADGWELVEAFGDKFEVDISLFRADRHFGPEGMPIGAPFVLLWWLVTWPFRRMRSQDKEGGMTAIRISDLIAAAQEKRWTL